MVLDFIFFLFFSIHKKVTALIWNMHNTHSHSQNIARAHSCFDDTCSFACSQSMCYGREWCLLSVYRVWVCVFVFDALYVHEPLHCAYYAQCSTFILRIIGKICSWHASTSNFPRLCSISFCFAHTLTHAHWIMTIRLSFAGL